jgi:hypothetical protein
MHLPRIFTVLLAGLGLVITLSSCQSLRERETEARNRRWGILPPEQPATGPAPTAPRQVPPSDGTVQGVPTTPPTPAPPPQPMPPSKLGVGVPVPGQPGIVRSPYTDNPNALLNVSGLASGTEVNDPYTGRTFLVP